MKRIAFALTVALLACSSLFAQQQPALTYSFQDITYPKDTFIQLLGVNNAGTIAGYRGAPDALKFRDLSGRGSSFPGVSFRRSCQV